MVWNRFTDCTCMRRGTLTIVSILCSAATSIPPPALSPSRLSVSARGPESAWSCRHDCAYCRLTSSMMVDVSASPTRIYKVQSSMYLGFSARAEQNCYNIGIEPTQILSWNLQRITLITEHTTSLLFPLSPMRIFDGCAGGMVFTICTITESFAAFPAHSGTAAKYSHP